VKNYNKRKVEIENLKQFFNKIVPAHKFVEIEFKNDSTIFRLGVAQGFFYESNMFYH